MEMLMLSDFTRADKHQVHLTVTDRNTSLARLGFLLGLSMRETTDMLISLEIPCQKDHFENCFPRYL